MVLHHQGGFSDNGQNDCGAGLDGPVVEVTQRLDPAMDLVIAGHTNDEFICEIDGKWVTMADNAGRLFTVIDATLSRSTGDLTVQTARNHPNSQAGVTPVPDLTDLIDRYVRFSAPRANTVVGIVTADISRQQNEAGESALGDVIADAHLATTKAADAGGAVVAFTNSGGIRKDIRFARSGTEADGELTYGEAFAVHPFGNSLVTMTLTGAQIDALLEQQFNDGDTGYGNLLQASAEFSYTWDAAAPVGPGWMRLALRSTESRWSPAGATGSPSTATWRTAAAASACWRRAPRGPGARLTWTPLSPTSPGPEQWLRGRRTASPASTDQWVDTGGMDVLRTGRRVEVHRRPVDSLEACKKA